MKNRTYLWITVLVVLLVAAAAALSVGVYSALALDSSTVSAAETSLEQAQDLCIATQPSDHTHAEGTAAHSHDQVIEIEEGKTHPTVALSVAPDPVSGWNVRVETANFRFSPENASTADVLGEGHAHLYVDGEKLARLYGEWFHIGKLEPGTHHIAVSLNGNSHAAYYYAGEPIEASVTLDVPAEAPAMSQPMASESSMENDHAHAEGTAVHSHGEVIEIEEGKTHPTVSLSVAADPVSGWNVQVETANFRFSPENASTADVLGEGHAHLYVDGEKLARLYGEWFHIGKLEPGTHHIAVSLNGNSHAAYYYAGEPIEAAVTLEVSE